MNEYQKYICEIFGKHPETFDEIAQATMSIINHNIKDYNARLIGFVWDINYSDLVSNSHHAPIGQSTNWWRDAEKPLGYPGFSGRVWIRISNKIPGFASSIFNGSLTHTGTGGLGSYDSIWDKVIAKSHKYNDYYPGEYYSWEYRFFIDDFPKFKSGEFREILDNYEAKIVWKKLMSEKLPVLNYRHRFVWEDPKIKINDDEYLNKYMV